jgi:hypothetical protein
MNPDNKPHKLKQLGQKWSLPHLQSSIVWSNAGRDNHTMYLDSWEIYIHKRNTCPLLWLLPLLRLVRACNHVSSAQRQQCSRSLSLIMVRSKFKMNKFKMKGPIWTLMNSLKAMLLNCSLYRESLYFVSYR